MQDPQYATMLTNINDEALNFTAVVEAWVPLIASDVVSQDLALPGVKMINKPCSNGNRDGDHLS